MEGPFPKVSLKHLPAGNLHRVPVVHTVWGKHTLCKWFFFWNGTHTTRNSVLMAIVSAKANGCCVCLLMCALCCMCMYFVLHCICPCRWNLPSQKHLIHKCREDLKCRKEWKAGNKEKVCLALHILVHSQKRFVKRPMMLTRHAERAGPPTEAITQFYSEIRGWDEHTQCHPCLSTNRGQCL